MLFYNNLEDYIQNERQKLFSLSRANIPECGIIEKVLLPGNNQDKHANPAYCQTHAVKELKVNYLGIQGDRHCRATRRSTGREKFLYPKGTMIREHRHILAVSLYDCQILSELVGAKITPELLGANLVIKREDGQPFSLSAVPLNTYFVINDGTEEDGVPPIATLRNYTQQQGCKITGNIIAESYKELNLFWDQEKDSSCMQRFVDNAKNNRGIICSIEQPVDNYASLCSGQKVRFKFPTGITP